MAASEWEQICPGSTEVLQNLAQVKGGELQEDHWRDIKRLPNRSVTWQRRGIGYSVSMIANESVSIWATAWRDLDKPLIRRSLTPALRTLTTPIDVGSFQQTLDELLKEIGPKVGLLNLRNQPNGIVISPLTPYLMNI